MNYFNKNEQSKITNQDEMKLKSLLSSDDKDQLYSFLYETDLNLNLINSLELIINNTLLTENYKILLIKNLKYDFLLNINQVDEYGNHPLIYCVKNNELELSNMVVHGLQS